jgi:hypothetical protein
MASLEHQIFYDGADRDKRKDSAMSRHGRQFLGRPEAKPIFPACEAHVMAIVCGRGQDPGANDLQELLSTREFNHS